MFFWSVKGLLGANFCGRVRSHEEKLHYEQGRACPLDVVYYRSVCGLSAFSYLAKARVDMDQE